MNTQENKAGLNPQDFQDLQEKRHGTECIQFEGQKNGKVWTPKHIRLSHSVELDAQKSLPVPSNKFVARYVF